MRKRRSWVCQAAGALALAACSAGAPPAEPAASPEGEQHAEPPSDPTPGAAPSAAPHPQTTSVKQEPEQAEVRELGRVEHSLESSVLSLALGRPRVAALVVQGEQVVPWLFEQGKWRAIPLPDRLGLSGPDLRGTRIYFGRDDRPRIMGGRELDGNPGQVYLRFRAAIWRVEKAEIGRLGGNPPGVLWGVLGHDDPEVVCKTGDQCIIKRRTGWKTMDAGLGTARRVDLQGKEAFAIHGHSVEILDGLAWREVSGGAKIDAPTGVWGDGKEHWISDASPGGARLWHGKDGSWESFPSPVSEPGTLWGSGPDDVWLAGAEGLAHYDGERWARVAGADGAVAEVFGREGEVWAAGASGVWLVKLTPGGRAGG
ncbi:MAG: hypothetical protein R3B89_27885 [Polyangiaceae bacterium]